MPQVLQFSSNQSGGITAHTVNINGPSKRIINVDSIINVLIKLPSGAFRLFYHTTDSEQIFLAGQIEKMLVKAGWKSIPPFQLVGGPNLEEGITLILNREKEPLLTLTNSLYNTLGKKGLNYSLVSQAEIEKISLDWTPTNKNLIPKDVATVLIFIGPNSATDLPNKN